MSVGIWGLRSLEGRKNTARKQEIRNIERVNLTSRLLSRLTTVLSYKRLETLALKLSCCSDSGQYRLGRDFAGGILTAEGEAQYSREYKRQV